MPAENALSLTGPAKGGFHALARATRASVARITVTHDGTRAFPMLLLSLDIGLGEPGQETTILTIKAFGHFDLPDVVPPDGLISVRAHELPEGTVTIAIAWREPPVIDPSANVWVEEVADQHVLEATGAPPSVIHAIQKAGRLFSKKGKYKIEIVNWEAWKQALVEWHSEHPGEEDR
jgi:hypothetical protein